jgi:hypothetical protein
LALFSVKVTEPWADSAGFASPGVKVEQGFKKLMMVWNRHFGSFCILISLHDFRG